MNEILDDQIETTLTVNKTLLYEWERTRKWTLFISVMGFIFTGIMVLAAIAFMFTGSNGVELYDGMSMGWLSILYIILAGVYGIPIYFLMKYSTLLKSGIHHRSQRVINEAFSYLRRHYKTFGIMLISLLGLYAIIISVAIMTNL